MSKYLLFVGLYSKETPTIQHNTVNSLNVFYFPIFFKNIYIYKHIQFNTMSCTQNGKRVEPQVLKKSIQHFKRCINVINKQRHR